MVVGLWFREVRAIIIVQARMGSTRFPGKILKKVMGRPLLEYQIERLRRVKNINDVVIATTTNQIDKPVKELCEELHCSYFRGSESDVLLRYYETAVKFNAECVVRVNSDCPLIDPGVIDEIIEYYFNHNELDYVSNILEKSYPIGLHTEVFSMKALRQANDNANSAIEREHVTPYIYRNPDIFKLFSYSIEDDLECGISLEGSEVKSLRTGKTQIIESYATVDQSELWLVNCYIPPYNHANSFAHEERRRRKLLVSRRELSKLWSATQRDGMTLVPLVLYFNHKGRAKLKIGIAKGKKQADKRATEAKRDWQRQKSRLLKEHT